MNTSEEAYHKIKANGLLSKREMQVYEALYDMGPMTARQLSEHIPGAWKRMADLVKSGAVSDNEYTICPVTGHRVTLYRITTAVPMKKERRPSRKELQDTICELRDRLSIYESSTGVLA